MTLLPLGCLQGTTTGERLPALWFGTRAESSGGAGVPVSDARMSLQGGTSGVVSLGLQQPISPAWCHGFAVSLQCTS